MERACHPEPDNDTTFSDDLLALHEIEAETRQAKTAQGIVIQHRYGDLGECFRSDDDKSFGIPSSQPRDFRDSRLDLPSSGPPSRLNMTGVSSPTMAPILSLGNSMLKRKRPDPTPRSPLKEVLTNSSTPRPEAIFEHDLEDDDQDIEERRLTASPLKRPKPSHVVEEVPSLHLGEAIVSPPLTSPASQVLPNEAASTQRTIQILASSLKIVQTACGKRHSIAPRLKRPTVSYEQLAAARSTVAPGRAQRSYYGIDIHSLIETAEAEAEAKAKIADVELAPVHPDQPVQSTERSSGQLWTEKYRARKFTDLIGDDRTHRQVMHWLKRWDQIVFPGSKPRPKLAKSGDRDLEQTHHRKVMLLTGPPGLGKTTLAHVCARQAGYEVQEINASDERSKNVVHGRIRDMVGTENVKQGATRTTNGTNTVRRAARPVCVVVDEVDGAVSGAGGTGEGGFIKALLDLLNTDHRNANKATHQGPGASRPKKKGDNFRMLRPLILICNDVYHPALRLLRQSSHAEIIHVGKPVLNNVATRLASIFNREGVPADSDAVRKLCEASWGVTSSKERNGAQGTGEGDVRSIMVMAEWVAGRFRASGPNAIAGPSRLTKRWVEDVFLGEMSRSGGAARGLGRGGAKEIVDRVFLEGAGLNKTTSATAAASNAVQVKISGVKGVAEAAKSAAMHNLRELVNSVGESDKIMTECFSSYPDHPWHDDTMLSKPAAAYDWLFFHDTLSSAVFQTNEWELAPYLCQPVLAFHNLFATSRTAKSRYTPRQGPNADKTTTTTAEEDPHPFRTPQASYAAHEAQKSHAATLDSLRAGLSLPLSRQFPTTATIATDLAPYVSRMLSPPVNPVLITGSGDSKYASTASIRRASEKLLVERAVNALLATGVAFDRLRLETGGAVGGPPGMHPHHHHQQQARQHAGWIYRMEPALDQFGAYATAAAAADDDDDPGAAGNDVGASGQRFAVRQILAQERARAVARDEAEARRRRVEVRRGVGEGDGHGVGDGHGHGAGHGHGHGHGHGQGQGQGHGGGSRAAGLLRSGSGGRSGIGAEAGEARPPVVAVKRDFFGREIVAAATVGTAEGQDQRSGAGSKDGGHDQAVPRKRVWVSYNEGYSNAVRKPVSLAELMREFG